MKKTRQDHFKDRNHKVFVKHLQRYAIMFLEAVGLNEGFRKETDAAFGKFWEREGDSLRKMEIVKVDSAGNRLSSTLLGDLIKKPDSNHDVLNQYLFSPEAHQVKQRYRLLNPYHYNQSALFASPGQLFVSSMIDADEFTKEIDGKTFLIFRSPCLQAIREKEPDYLQIKINLFWPKEEIMNIFELILDKTLDERKSAGKNTFIRGKTVDSFPFKAWHMNKKQGKTPWEITKELNPGIKTLTAKDCNMIKCPDTLEFKNLSVKKKETYSNKSCGKQDSCRMAKALLKNVRDAIAKAESLIASVHPIS